MTTHDILCARAQACVDHDSATIALCDAALAGSADARAALVRQSAGRRVGRATVIRTGLVPRSKTTVPMVWNLAEQLRLWDTPSFGGDEVR